MPLHFVTIKHMSKSGKFNGVGKIFLDLFNLYKYTLITTIHFMIDDVKDSQYFQTNGSKMFVLGKVDLIGVTLDKYLRKSLIYR